MIPRKPLKIIVTYPSPSEAELGGKLGLAHVLGHSADGGHRIHVGDVQVRVGPVGVVHHVEHVHAEDELPAIATDRKTLAETAVHVGEAGADHRISSSVTESRQAGDGVHRGRDGEGRRIEPMLGPTLAAREIGADAVDGVRPVVGAERSAVGVGGGEVAAGSKALDAAQPPSTDDAVSPSGKAGAESSGPADGNLPGEVAGDLMPPYIVAVGAVAAQILGVEQGRVGGDEGAANVLRLPPRRSE